MMPVLQNMRVQTENLLYPELRPDGRSDRDRLLQKATETRFDIVEWIGLLAALVFVVSLTRYSVADLGFVDCAAVALVNVLVAILLLALLPDRFWCDEKDAGCARSCAEHADSRRSVIGATAR